MTCRLIGPNGLNLFDLSSVPAAQPLPTTNGSPQERATLYCGPCDQSTVQPAPARASPRSASMGRELSRITPSRERMRGGVTDRRVEECRHNTARGTAF